MEHITLNNGVEMPVLGYGTYQTPPRITEQCVTEALRTIDGSLRKKELVGIYGSDLSRVCGL